MVAMQPGKDQRPWQLCGRCWLDGLRPMSEIVVTTKTGTSVLPSSGKRYEYKETITKRGRG
jgi:hypothetical protein